jgi:hypothetical protein
MKSHFYSNFINGFLTSVITFVIVQIAPLPEFPWNLDKVGIFAIVSFILGVIILRNKPLVSLIGAVIGGILAGFVIFNYGVLITDWATNIFLGGVLVGVVGTFVRYAITMIMSFI